MKKIMFVLVLAVALVAMMSGVASAAYRADIQVDESLAAHDGFGASTNFCKQCHDVHGGVLADDNTPLFRYGVVADSCAYCHVGGGAMSGAQVYTVATFEAEHTIGELAIPDRNTADGLGSDAKLGCIDCHMAAPHGAGTASSWGTSGALITSAYNDPNDYCGALCHDMNDEGALGGTGADATHPIVATVTDSTVANAATVSCLNCHDATTVATVSEFPHRSGGWAFLQNTALDADASAATQPLDGVCMTCHPNVGNTF